MEEDGEDMTPFWLQSTTNRRRADSIRNGLASIFFSSGLLIILLLVIAVSFLVFVVPSTLSAQIFRPNSVKKSWDSLNIVLVLFALVFGFLNRATNQDRNNDEYQTSPISGNQIQKSSPSTPQRQWYDYSTNEAQKSNLSTFPQQWYGYSDQMAYNNANISRGGLRRTSSSYPDLLEASSQFMSGDDPWRFYDDMNVDTHWVSETGQLLRRRSWKDKFEDARVAESKNIYVDTFVNRPKEASNTPRPPSPPPPTSSPTPPSLPPPSPTMPKEKPKRAYRSVAHKGERRSKRKDNELENKEPISSPVTPPPPPPPPPALARFVDQKSSKTDKKRSGGSATKDFLNSLYHKKKKKQRQKSIENFDALLYQSQTPPLQFQLPPASARPPPPPPLPPPPSVFHNLFSSKKSKRKRPVQDISASTSSPPQPTPPTPAIHSKPSTSQTTTVTTHKSPKPVKVRSFDRVEENSNSGGESPLIPIPPPPPPPPPFAKSLSWKFVVQGDYVRVDSSLSSRSGSSDIDDVESDGTPTATDGADAMTFPPSPLFFPSPDVNTKAENFITKFRAGLKLEKIDSMNKRQGLGLSKLGRGSDSTQL